MLSPAVHPRSGSGKASQTNKLILIIDKQGSCIGLYSINRPEWLITEHACSSYSFISVPLYDTLGKLLFSKYCYCCFGGGIRNTLEFLFISPNDFTQPSKEILMYSGAFGKIKKNLGVSQFLGLYYTVHFSTSAY